MSLELSSMTFVSRRYREWHRLRESLPDASGAVRAPFPPKRLACLMCVSDGALEEERAEALQAWAAELLSLPGALQWPQVGAFFRLGLSGPKTDVGAAKAAPAEWEEDMLRFP